MVFKVRNCRNRDPRVTARTEPGGAPSSLHPECCTGSGEAHHRREKYHNRPPISSPSLGMEKEVMHGPPCQREMGYDDESFLRLGLLTPYSVSGTGSLVLGEFAHRVCRCRPVRLEDGPGDVARLVNGQSALVCLAGVEVNNLAAYPAGECF